MLNSPLFQLALALLLVFLVMSAIVSLTQQFVVEGFRMRARNLRRSITRMLSDKTYKDEIAKRFYRHPMTASLSGGRAEATYMEPETFITALASAVQPKWSNGDAVMALPASVAALKDGELKQRLQLILPPAGASREEISAAVRAWFDTSAQKMQERFKADCVALSWGIAALVTIGLNVSAIEIGRRLQDNDNLRSALASVTPELVQSSAIASFASTPGETQADTQAGGATAGLNPNEVVTLLTVVRCATGDSDIPVGWDWMAGVVQSVSERSALESNNACADARQRIAGNAVLEQRLAVLEARAPQVTLTSTETAASAAGATSVQPLAASSPTTAAEQAQPIYGPTFRRNGIWETLLGWLIVVVAAAQGAPFWFNAIRRIVGRN